MVTSVMDLFRSWSPLKLPLRLIRDNRGGLAHDGIYRLPTYLLSHVLVVQLCGMCSDQPVRAEARAGKSPDASGRHEGQGH